MEFEETELSVRLRLKRIGRRHHPVYRVVAVDRRKPRDGRVIEECGHYDPTNADEDKQVTLDQAKIEKWLNVGAQPSDTVRNLLKKQGITRTA